MSNTNENILEIQQFINKMKFAPNVEYFSSKYWKYLFYIFVRYFNILTF